MKPTYIGRLHLENYKCFKGKQEISFLDEQGYLYQWTIILGNNNMGKTNLLKAVALMEPMIDPFDEKKEKYVPKAVWSSYLKDEKSIVSLDLYTSDSLLEKQGDLFKWSLAVSTDVYAFDHFPANEDILKLYSYGVSRRSNKNTNFSETEIDNAATLFGQVDGLTNIEEWLFRLKYATLNAQNGTKEKAEKRLQLVEQLVVSEMFPEIEGVQFITDEKLNNYIEFKTANGWYRLDDLGYGYQSSLAWVIDLCKKMVERYPESSNPLQEPAIVLVDEIDMHLHPSWQLRIVQYLSEHFPNTQFIATTHSPTILQALTRVNLVILRKDADAVKITPFKTADSFQGWELSEIATELMDAPVHSEKYKELIQRFEEALDADDYNKAKLAYEELLKILHPESAERTIRSIQFSQISREDDKA